MNQWEFYPDTESGLSFMESKPKISVIIPARNEEKFLPSCLRAIKAQRGGFDYEIIVVDNVSLDTTVLIAGQWGAQVLREAKIGVGAARRTGTAAARGDYVLNLDADSRLPDNYFVEALKRFERDPRLVCLGGQMYYYDAPRWKNWLRRPVHWGFWLLALAISGGRVGPMGNNMIFKKEVYDKTGGFNAGLKFGEDMDLARQLSRFGRVRLDMGLKCLVSVRRFTFNKKLWILFLNFFKMCMIGAPLVNELPEHKN